MSACLIGAVGRAVEQSGPERPIEFCLDRDDLLLSDHGHVVVSSDHEHFVRTRPGDRNGPAKALAFKFAAATGNLVETGQLMLRNPISPERVYITNGGRYIVTLGGLDEGALTKNAVVIYDRQKNLSKAFSARDFLPAQVTGAAGFSTEEWCNAKVTNGPVLDNETMRLYPNNTHRVQGSPPGLLLVDINIGKMAVGILPKEEETRFPTTGVHIGYTRRSVRRPDGSSYVVIEPVPSKFVPEVYVSMSGDHVVRVINGDAKGNAAAAILDFVPARETYVASGRLALRNPTAPGEAFITNDGRYVVTLDDIWQNGATANAVVIYYRRENVSRAFRLESFLPPKAVRAIPFYPPGMRVWYDGWETLVDNGGLKVYPSGMRKRADSPKGLSLVVIDLGRMTVSLLPEK
jgi:hypothetical protein